MSLVFEFCGVLLATIFKSGGSLLGYFWLLLGTWRVPGQPSGPYLASKAQEVRKGGPNDVKMEAPGILLERPGALLDSL